MRESVTSNCLSVRESEQGAAEGGPEASVTKTAAHARPSGLKRHLRREEAFKEGN